MYKRQGVCLAWGRHFFNLKHLGVVKPWILVSSFIGLVAIAVVLSSTSVNQKSTVTVGDTFAAQSELFDEAKVTQLVQVHCANCHSATPSQTGFTAAPAGLIIDSSAQLVSQKVRALPALNSGYMPLGNFHQLTDIERKGLIEWLNAQ